MSAKYPSLRVEGGFLTAEILDDIAAGKASGQKPRDFGLPDRARLIDEISSTWSDARGLWQTFWRRAETPEKGETGVSFTRSLWLVPFFKLLGYDLKLQERAAEVDGLTFAISHRIDAAPNSPPVHLVGAWQSLDRRAESGRPRLAPHSLLQEYLNRTEYLWGIVSNGLKLRLLRNSQLIRRQAYLEFNLETMFNGERFADFALFFRLLHRSRLPHPDAKPDACLLEQWYQQTIEQGGRVREHLREGVESAIPALANAILKHPRNRDIRQAIESGDLKTQALYEELLRLVYRLLFLMVTEERNLLTANEIYRQHYSISRIRLLCENRYGRNQHVDLWAGLQSTFRLFASKEFGHILQVPPLNGDLFNLNKTPHLNSVTIANADFLNAFWNLAMYREDRRSAPRRVNYSALDVEELGSVYESLLDLQPVFTQEEGLPAFSLVKGTQRKTTGSYYTRPELVDELVQNALVPVIEERLSAARTPKDKEKALLEITVCDPACGSGHFLLAAGRRLARELAQIRSGEEEPSPSEYRLALRDVIGHCIYGVDHNPLAVELCKVALWIEGHAEGKPLSFLDHRILCGNSLVGMRDLAILKKGVPDDAYKPVTGDDKDVAKEIKKQNRRESAGFQTLDFSPEQDVTDLALARKELFELPDDTPEQIRKKKDVLERTRASRKYAADRLAAHLWCAAFFVELSKKNFEDKVIPTTGTVLNALEQRQPWPPVAGLVEEIDCRVRFLHWPLEFPEVFARGGFDVILCNPPWERIKLQQEEFFASRDLTISRAPNKAARDQLIRQLRAQNPSLWREYCFALHDAESLSRFLRASGLYPLTARGDINTYSVFAERFTALVRPEGRVGAVLPTGIATDDTNKRFFAHIATSGRLAALYDFENRKGLFPAVDSRVKFSLVTIRGGPPPVPEPAQFAFFLTRAEQLRDPQRVFPLHPDDFALLNPNTKTCPIFRTRADAELTRKIYQRVPVLVNETTGENPWGIRFMRMFDMSNDSHLFRTREQLEAEGFALRGNHFVKADEEYVPLYEAKMMHQYNHRFGDYAMKPPGSQGTELPPIPPERLADPNYVVLPRYWVRREDLPDLGGRQWLLGFRDITNATNERTAIFAVLPPVGVGNNLPIMSLARPCASLLACIDSLVFDYIARQTVAGVHMNFFLVQQLAVLPPSSYTEAHLAFITPRVLELTCTAWDIQPFLDYVWREADANLRAAIQRQWCENREATGGHTYDPPEWYTPPEDPCPLPPFKWDDDRRAVLRAELDAYYAKLYGLDERDLRYILDPAGVYGPDFPGETFRVLKKNEIARYDEYRTCRLVLEAWERIQRS
jgi:hypothetical protein